MPTFFWTRSDAVRHVYFNADSRRSAAMAVGVVVASIAAFLIVHPLVGTSSIAFIFLPVVAIAALLGIVAGVSAALLFPLGAAAILALVGDPDALLFRSPAMLPAYLATGIIALVAGRLHDLGIWLRRQRDELRREVVRREAVEQDRSTIQDRLRVILDNLPVMIIATDERGVIDFHGGAGVVRIGGQPGSAVGQSVHDRFAQLPDHLAYWTGALAGHTTRGVIDIGGNQFSVSVMPLRTSLGENRGAVGLAIDETELFAAQRAVEHLRLHDALTGLPNRERFVASVEERLANAAGEAFVVLAVEFENVHEVNDTLGHAAGDDLLCVIAERMSSEPVQLVARIGGTDFAIVVAGAMSHARGIAARLLAVVEAPVPLGGELIRPEVMLGMASSAGAVSASDLLRQATVAADTARRTGRNMAAYTIERDQHLPGQLSMAADLRQAIGSDQLFLHYQPIVQMSDRSIVGVEALARWTHPVHGPVSPVEFIGLAERVGLIRPLTDWVLHRAITDAHDVFTPKGIEVSINLSMRDLRDDELPRVVESLIGANGGMPLVRLELTESAVMTDAQHAIEVVQRLRALGARISIDDFGTGYSSLAYLQRLPVDALKIDRSFVRELYRDAASAAIVRAVIELARSLSLRVVAEGVESEAIWTLLREWRCDLAQGYLIARPMALSDVVAWLAAKAAERAVRPPA